MTRWNFDKAAQLTPPDPEEESPTERADRLEREAIEADAEAYKRERLNDLRRGLR